jgi:hypothetical protein
MHEEVDQHEDADRDTEQPGEEVLSHDHLLRGWIA